MHHAVGQTTRCDKLRSKPRSQANIPLAYGGRVDAFKNAWPVPRTLKWWFYGIKQRTLVLFALVLIV